MGALTLCRWVDGRKVTAAYVENGPPALEPFLSWDQEPECKAWITRPGPWSEVAMPMWSTRGELVQPLWGYVGCQVKSTKPIGTHECSHGELVYDVHPSPVYSSDLIGLWSLQQSGGNFLLSQLRD